MSRSLLVALLALVALPAAARADPIGATFTFSPSAPLTGQKVTFTGTPTPDSEDIQTWSWTVDGDFAGSRPTMTWTFTTPGKHSVVLQVEDDDSDQATARAEVTVDQAPSRQVSAGDFVAQLFSGPLVPLELRVLRGGAVAFDQRFGTVVPEALRATDLDADGVAEVVFGYRRGRTHETAVLQETPAGFRGHRHVWGRARAGRLVAGQGGLVWVSSDARLRSAFKHAGAPARIVAYRGGRFLNVTRDYPALVRKDAAHWRHRSPAAWAADEYSLGHRARVWQVVHGRFAVRLRRWLHAHGY
jgi:hypothetical protein